MSLAFLSEPLYRKLEKNEARLNASGEPVFICYKDYLKAQQWVGVIQIPGLLIEILPKVDNADQRSRELVESHWCEARQNLLYMLSIIGDLPVRARGLAWLGARKSPLNETLAVLFADRLKTELLRGPEKNYVSKEDNLHCFRGRLLTSQHLLKNAAHREKFYCRFDVFSEDTPLNQVFKYAVKSLLGITKAAVAQDKLRHCLLILDEVSDIRVTQKHIDAVTFTRQNNRFEALFQFCKLIIGEKSPTIKSGDTLSFSLLFDMNKVFERFIATYLQREVISCLPGYQVYSQSYGNHRPLYQNERSTGELYLKPDILIRRRSDNSLLVIDTKWKRFNQRPSESDLYQLYAYTQRYGCEQSILLYPFFPEKQAMDFFILDETGKRSGRKVGIRFVNMNRNLLLNAEKEILTKDLMQLIQSGFSLDSNPQ